MEFLWTWTFNDKLCWLFKQSQKNLKSQVKVPVLMSVILKKTKKKTTKDQLLLSYLGYFHTTKSLKSQDIVAIETFKFKSFNSNNDSCS